MLLNVPPLLRTLLRGSLLAGCLSTACAADIGTFAVHGFGSQDFMRASANTYLGADTHGTWDNNFLGLVASVEINEVSKLWAQLEASSTEPTRFTWFFLDYDFSDAASVHIGRVKYPLGFYNETIDTKFLQVTSLEPLLYQGAADMVHDSYNGAGLDYDQSLGAGGRITWQIYGGNTFDVDPPPNSRDRQAFGGRVTYETPVNGLQFMLSAYRTRVEVLATGDMIDEDRVIASAGYIIGEWDVRAEYGQHEFQGVTSDAYYAQALRMFTSRWGVFGRYDDYVSDKSEKSSDSFHQKTVVLGVQYLPRSNIAVRIENHFNSGYALPVASGEIAVGEGTRTWNLLVAGIHFVF